MSTWSTGLVKHEVPQGQCPECGKPHTMEGIPCDALVRRCNVCGHMQLEEGECERCPDGIVTLQKCEGIAQSLSFH